MLNTELPVKYHSDKLAIYPTFPDRLFKITISFFKQLIDGTVFEFYYEKEIKKAGRDILKHLTHLTPITADMSNEQKMQTYYEHL